jgi:putative YphP/YqiW family bacilliredoxin
MYPAEIVEPCRLDLTEAGFEELKSADEVDAVVKGNGTALIVINSVCGCSAGSARPGVKIAIQHSNRPDQLATAFAGVDAEATNQVRSHIHGYPPSSPSIALFKNGQAVYFLERHQIEGRSPQEIAFDLVTAFDEHCK